MSEAHHLFGRTPGRVASLSRAAAGFFCAAFIGFCLSTSAHADTPPHLRVRGTPLIDAHASRDHGRLALDARVLDDAAAPVGGAAVSVTIARADAPDRPIAIDAEGPAAPLPCGAAPTDARVRAHVEVAGPALRVRADDGGRVCLWIPLAVDRYVVKLATDATDFLAPASAELPVDLSRRSVLLRFDPEPRIIALDGPAATLDVLAIYDEQSQGTLAFAQGIGVTVTTESGKAVASGPIGPNGRFTFVVAPQAVGPPGRGELRVQFDGDADTMSSRHVAPVQRDARVTLVAGAVAAGDPEQGLTVPVEARTVFGGVPSGSVEARLGGVLVGAAPIHAGKAALVVTFAQPRTSSANLTLRYLPEAPWYQAGEAIAVAVPLRGPSPWRRAPLVVGALLIASWLFAGRLTRRRKDRTVVMSRPPMPEGTAGISVIRSSRQRSGAWHGRVIDAHDGTPVVRPRLSVEEPGFEGAKVVTSVFGDEYGTFVFELPRAAAANAELVVEAPLHAQLRQALPGAGELSIALVLRKRRLLERLVRWAQRRGAPYDAKPEPTPAQVRKAARAAPDAARWADAVERAAYEGGEVDARVEAEVDALEPRHPEPRPAGGARPPK